MIERMRFQRQCGSLDEFNHTLSRFSEMSHHLSAGLSARRLERIGSLSLALAAQEYSAYMLSLPFGLLAPVWVKGQGNNPLRDGEKQPLAGSIMSNQEE